MLKLWDVFTAFILGANHQDLTQRTTWADRMKSDPDFAKCWVVAIKTLFDLEDVNKNGVLEKDEFKSFIR